MEYYVAVKKKEVDLYSLIWTDAEDIYFRLKKSVRMNMSGITPVL